MPGTNRSVRGRHRRQLILTAAGELLMEQGFAAVSHRAVAQRAGVPLAATTYYFDTLDSLCAEALRELADRWLVTARTVLAELPGTLRGPGQVAEAIRRVAAPGGDAAELTLYERYLEAARHPHLRTVITGYDAEVDALLGEVLRRGGLDSSPATARLVLAVADGATVRALAEGRPTTSVTAVLEQLIPTLPRGG